MNIRAETQRSDAKGKCKVTEGPHNEGDLIRVTVFNEGPEGTQSLTSIVLCRTHYGAWRDAIAGLWTIGY